MIAILATVNANGLLPFGAIVCRGTTYQTVMVLEKDQGKLVEIEAIAAQVNK